MVCHQNKQTKNVTLGKSCTSQNCVSQMRMGGMGSDETHSARFPGFHESQVEEAQAQEGTLERQMRCPGRR
jgi:hypothetical protein